MSDDCSVEQREWLSFVKPNDLSGQKVQKRHKAQVLNNDP